MSHQHAVGGRPKNLAKAPWLTLTCQPHCTPSFQLQKDHPHDKLVFNASQAYCGWLIEARLGSNSRLQGRRS